MQITLTLTVTFDSSLLMSADEFRYNFLSGITTKGFDGYSLNNQQLENYIRNHTKLCESFLRIKIIPRVMSEQQDYERDYFRNWGYLRTNYDIQKPISLTGKLGTLTTTEFVIDVVQVKQQMSDELVRNLNVIPNRSFFVVYTTALYIMLNWQFIPNYFTIIYLTGYKQTPDDIYNYIGKKALSDVLTTLGNIIMPIGVSSSSKSIDGVSQSISSTRTASTNLFTAAQNHLREEFKQLETILKSQYQPILFFRL